jgi:lipopolysaccharide/colanic/teichoic acid biosynthesis glycosyltransferase
MLIESIPLPESAYKNKDVSPKVGGSKLFWGGKRALDISFSLFLAPFVFAIAVCLICLNPIFNRGPLFFRQRRMGRHCRPFTALKFRSMRSVTTVERGPDDPLEVSRITPLGNFLRKSRIDELPQIFNVLKGEMSLIGPRPDYLAHAEYYLETVPGYRQRHCIRPGISGLAQTYLGYAEGVRATRNKVQKDLIYIRRASFTMELWIFWSTLRAVFGRAGS